MDNLYARCDFFVQHAERAVGYYTEQLGFSLDWNHQEESRTIVCQVSLFGFELILNQVDDRTRARAGHGRLFIGLDDQQGGPFRKHVLAARIPVQRVEWGRPTLVIRDLDANELFFWLPNDDFTGLEIPALESSER